MNNKLWLVICLIALALALSACLPDGQSEEQQPAESAPVEGSFVFTEDNYPRMGGSLAALPLGEAVTAAALSIEREAAGQLIRFENSTTWNYNALVDGTFDILLAYEPSQEAFDYAAEQRFEWEMTAIGRDALVFIANEANPVAGLSTEQIVGIYSGDIVDWSEVGGNGGAIIPYQRNKDSGSQTLFDLLIPMEGRLMDAPAEYVADSMIGLLEVIADYDNSADALGYTVYYYLTNMETDKLSRSKILAVDGVEPNNDSIKSGAYPYTNDFYVVIPADTPEDSPVRILYNWICSAQVAQLGETENYVMLNGGQ
ncbi:MAG: substrate-binding domain-containing protein [Bacillota bacterium]|nr:substrate-binding domain-containing protein [Bacillota bacterium]